VPGPIGDDRLQLSWSSELGQYKVGNLVDAFLDAGTDVVRLADRAPLEDGVDGGAVILHVDPLPTVVDRCVER
jgi:hypothetical protein